ncbi:hypothetical protein [Hyphobacterium indicum]|uniref:hypothetical protein n=1 Tax=Hyphobacterium indicum TaxID=2162714 RepID=UPI000F63D836|nr:hypothetical protein [Hyphobacterium indicum]
MDFSNVDIQTAFITALTALVLFVLKDIILSGFKNWRSDRKTAAEIYRIYASPIAVASVSLFWRLNEIFDQSSRSHYLTEELRVSDFDRYKYLSTIYRFGRLLGWLNAYERELFSRSVSSSRQAKIVDIAISRFRENIADGAHVEALRFKSVISCLNESELAADLDEAQLTIQIDRILQTFLAGPQATLAIDLSEKLKSKLANEVVQTINNTSGVKFSNESLPVDAIIDALSIREAWLYRDYQDALGDVFLKKADRERRDFEAISYREFEEIFNDQNSGSQIWLSRFCRLFDDLEVSAANRFDARLMALENAFYYIAELILALRNVRYARISINKKTIERAKQIVSSDTWRRATSP